MKRLLIICFWLHVVQSIWAQVPQGINYQAVIRDNQGNVLSNATVGLRVQIRQGSSNGSIVYSESFSPTTSSLGLVNVVIGQGTPITGVFSAINWASGSYFFEPGVDITGGSSYVNMGTQQFMSVPYALYAANSGGGGGTLDAAYDFGGPGSGRTITADSGPVQINASGSNTAGLAVLMTGTGNSINIENTNTSNGFATLQALTNSATANNSAIFGRSSGAARGVAGEVQGSASADAAVRGNNLRTTGGIGVDGIGFNGVAGASNYNQGFAVFGQNSGNPNVPSANYATGIAGIGGVGVQGQTLNGQLPGVLGQNLNNTITYNNIAVLGSSNTGVGVWGDNLDLSFYGVFSNGDFGATGVKTFLIDYPADPANKYLKHFSVESDEVLNIYRGTAVLNANGEAEVILDSYVEMVNKNFTYHLTPIGAYAPLYIKSKIQAGKFIIAGGLSGMEVSWQITGERNDPYLQRYPEKRSVITDKREGERGKYLLPQLYNLPDENRIIYLPNKEIQISR